MWRGVVTRGAGGRMQACMLHACMHGMMSGAGKFRCWHKAGAAVALDEACCLDNGEVWWVQGVGGLWTLGLQVGPIDAQPPLPKPQQ